MLDLKDLEDIGSRIDGLVEGWVKKTPKQQEAAGRKVSEDDPLVSFWLGSDFVKERALSALLRTALRNVPVIRVKDEAMLKGTINSCLHNLVGKNFPSGGPPVSSIGRGAFGMVVKHPAKPDRVVKVIPLRKEEDVEDVLREAQIMKAASDLGVSPKFYGITACLPPKNPVIMIEMAAMKRTLMDWVGEGRTPDEVDRMLFKVEKKLDKLHAAGILHNDLHGDNVMLDGKGEPFVVDFGLSTNNRHGIDMRKFPSIKRERAFLAMHLQESGEFRSAAPAVLRYVAGALAGMSGGR